MPTLKSVAVEYFWANAQRIKLKKDITPLKDTITDDLVWYTMVAWTLLQKRNNGGSLWHLTNAMNAKDLPACHKYLSQILEIIDVTASDYLPEQIEFPDPKDKDPFFATNLVLFSLLDRFVHEDTENNE